jgi:hypothetical protein
MNATAGKRYLSGVRRHGFTALGEKKRRLVAFHDGDKNRGGLQSLPEIELGRAAIETRFDMRAPRPHSLARRILIFALANHSGGSLPHGISRVRVTRPKEGPRFVLSRVLA